MKRQKITREMRCRTANEIALVLQERAATSEDDADEDDAEYAAQLRSDQELWRKLFRVADRDADRYCS